MGWAGYGARIKLAKLAALAAALGGLGFPGFPGGSAIQAADMITAAQFCQQQGNGFAIVGLIFEWGQGPELARQG